MAAHASEYASDVHLNAITKLYGTAYAVRDMNLAIEAGEFVSLLGPSGCGKTTTLRMIGGFELPDAGTITIGGHEVQKLPPYKRPVNTVFQSYALFPHMTVADNVAYGLKFSKTPKKEYSSRVTEALDMVRMRDFAGRRPGQLSGGQQQRIALARALVNRPSVLLLDEPMSALDRKLREEMQIELKLLQQQLGITFIFVTHDQEEAMSMSDRIAIMKDGQIEQIGTATDVYDEPVSEYVAAFIGQQSFVYGTVERVSGDAVTIAGDGVTVASTHPPHRESTEVGDAVVAAIRPETIAVGPAAEEGPNSVNATLMSVSHLGALLQIVAITPKGLKFVARTTKHVDLPTTVGTTINCSWSAETVHVY
ncbi:MAG TPA: ABC transporter ATP-binding protein [Pseudoclavibacter sp.]|nr:ABC transporter ATP-binding protein [Pseudoclavibacter sp.]